MNTFQLATGLTKPMPNPIIKDQPWTALAPMQDVTDLSFMTLLSEYGPPDFFFTEYFRVHEHSTLEKYILASITQNPTDRPVFAQIIGEDLFHIERTAKALQDYPIAGVDLNMGCPAPKVYRKNVGGGLLREPSKIDELFACLRESCKGRFTVKTRIGFDQCEFYDSVLELVNKHNIDLLSIHGRTVKQMYRGDVDYDRIAQAVEFVNCPVFANGNITSAAKAQAVINHTKAAGAMIGRSAIRNPWIFRQCREYFAGEEIFRPKLIDIRGYIDRLWIHTTNPTVPEKHRLNRMKKFLNFVGQGVDQEGKFLHRIRRATQAKVFFNECDAFLINNGNSERLFASEPFSGVIARPNCED